MENMTLYGPTGKCHGDNDPKTYLIPLEQCFSPAQLFPKDPQWGTSDTLDSCNRSHITRQFFGTVDGTCKGPVTSSFTLPLHECVGPFGKPRPWGSFSCPINTTTTTTTTNNNNNNNNNIIIN